jgi:hypothetical protein
MKKIVLLSLSCCLSLCSYSQTVPDGWQQKEKYSFVENKGQIRDQYGNMRSDIDFRLQSPDVSIMVGDASIHYQWYKAESDLRQAMKERKAAEVNTYRMDVELLGANKAAVMTTEEPQQYYEKYYLEHLGLNGTKAESFRKVTYHDVYPGVDWVVYLAKSTTGNETMKYDFVVRPGGRVSDIKLSYSGATSLSLDGQGALVATTPMGTIKEDAPYSYVMADRNSNEKVKVASRFVLNGNVLSFQTDDYKGTLVIDPELEWSTYYGGYGFDLGTVLTCDNIGNVYLTGASWFGLNITTTGSHQYANAGDFDAFLVKFDEAGNRLWGTYYGGPSTDYGFGLACDANNRVYISGITTSYTGIATAGCHQPASAGLGDNFLARFDTDGNRIWGTFYGGTGDEYNGLCAADNYGHVYLTGTTTSTSGIAYNGHSNTYNGGQDGYLAQFDTAGVRQWATYYGGTAEDAGDGVVCDLSGNVYLGGHTRSFGGIATIGSHQTALAGDVDNFLVKFNISGTRQWGTYYGGTEEDDNNRLKCVTVDQLGNPYLAGHTKSASGIATAGSHKPTLSGVYDGFLVKFNSQGQRQWATYLGGDGDEYGGGISCDYSNRVVWTGMTTSTSGLATANAYQPASGGGTDAFFVRFMPDGVQEYGTFFGGSGGDEGYAVGFDYIGNAYISGGTTSPNNIATPGAFETIYYGGIGIFLTKFCTANVPGNITGPDSICANSIVDFEAPMVPGATNYIWTLPAGWQGSSNTNEITVTTSGTGGVISVQVVRCDSSVALQKDVYVYPDVPAEIVENNFVLSTVNTHETYQWMFEGVVIPGATADTFVATENGEYSVAVTNAGDCADTSEIYTVSGIISVKDLALTEDAIGIYPNPATDVIHIRSAAQVHVQMCSIDGKVLLEQSGTDAINIAHLPAGVYMLRFTDKNGNGTITKRFTRIAQR